MADIRNKGQGWGDGVGEGFTWPKSEYARWVVLLQKFASAGLGLSYREFGPLAIGRFRARTEGPLMSSWRGETLEELLEQLEAAGEILAARARGERTPSLATTHRDELKKAA